MAYAFPISSDSEVVHKLDEVRGMHPKARHVCFAFQYGVENLTYRVNDDGEPSGSAGTPIYNAIRSRELTNVLVAVVRYFGGTKLGIRGLIDAYRSSSEQALNNADIIKKYQTKTCKVIVDMDKAGVLLSALKKMNTKVISSHYSKHAEFILQIRKSQLEKVERQIISTIHDISVSEIDENFVPNKVKLETL